MIYYREPSETCIHQTRWFCSNSIFFGTLRTFFQFSLELQTIGISIKYRSRRYRKLQRTASNSSWPQSYSTSKLGDRKVPKSFWHFLDRWSGRSARRQHRQIGKKSGQTPKSSENQRFCCMTSKCDFSETTGSWRLKFLPVSDLGQHFQFLVFPSSHYSKMFSYYLPSWMAILPGPELQVTKMVNFARRLHFLDFSETIRSRLFCLGIV